MEKIYKGEEKKFAINLTAQGFSMDEDDFEIEVATPKGSVKASKSAPTNDLRIFRDPELTDGSSPDSSGGSTEEETGTWYGIIDTSKLPGTGEIKVIGTAFITDANANDGVRKEIAVTTLGTLANP